ncbi:MAG: hypothetical protein JXN64_02110 [Spirochaetes bacterium]|nr:hypothetical protein [Spirochaetota bacterium]
MKKFMLFFIYLGIACLLLFPACFNNDDDDDDDDGLGNTLTIAGTITHVFDKGDETWTADFVHNDGEDYELNGEGATDHLLDTDDDNNSVLDLSYGIPDSTWLIAPSDWGLTSSSSTAKIFYVGPIEVTPNPDTASYYEGNFDYATNGYVQYYEYIYTSKATTISGTVPDGGKTYIYNNVAISAGWNKIICKTANGTTFNYYGGTISETKWTKMID